jgi:N-acetylglucosamine kinase-like BadF-type ATPase
MACAEAGLELGSVHFEVACLGFSGGPKDKDPLLRQMLKFDRMLVLTDAPIALTGATGGQPGIITIAGTGSISFGRNAAGKTVRAGGWGYVFGDEGGAFDLTRQALRAALRHEEGWGPPTVLTEMLLQATSAANVNDLLHSFYTTDFPRPAIAKLSKLVDEAANAGDAVARELLLHAARQLAEITGAVRAQLFEPGEPAKVAYIGGVFKSGLLRERFRMLVELTDGNTLGAPAYGPAAGALLEAYREAGLKPELTNVPDLK